MERCDSSNGSWVVGVWANPPIAAAISRIAYLAQLEFLDTLSIHLRDIEYAPLVDGHEVGQLEDVRAAPAINHLTTGVDMKNLVDFAFGDQQFVAVHEQAVRIAEARPDGQPLAAGVEDLHAVVAPVGDVDVVICIDRQAVAELELTGSGA